MSKSVIMRAEMVRLEQLTGKVNIKSSEYAEQCAVFEWAELMRHKRPELELLWASANGGLRDKVTASKLRKSGVKAGVPDIFLAVPRGVYAGLFIEMKVHPNKPTARQCEVIENLREQGYAVAVCYGAEQAIEAISDYLRGRSWSETVRIVNEYVARNHCGSGGGGEVCEYS